MSVVNKMLQDLDERNSIDNVDSADYQENTSKRARYMIIFIGVVLMVAVAYFTYRTLGPSYFEDALVKIGLNIGEAEETPKTVKKVSVNSQLDEMMPTIEGTKTVTEQPAKTLSEVAENPAEVTNNAPVTIAKSSNEADVIDTNVEDSSAEDVITAPENKDPDNHQESGDVNNDFQVTRSVTQTTEERIATLQLQVNEAIEDKRIDQAIAIMEEVLDIRSDQHEIRKRLAVVLYSNDQPERAENVLLEGVDIAPQRSDIRMMLARLLLRKKQYQQVYDILQPLEEDLSKGSELMALKASAAQQLEYHEEAGSLYSRLTSYEPNQARWWLGLGISMDKQGETRPALLAYERAIDLEQLSLPVSDFIRQRIEVLGR